MLRRHVPDDTYRFEPARDFTGRNVYRASLIRLENLESAHADALRAGHLDGVIAFAKARALERLRAYDLAAQHYREAAEREAELRDEALRAAALCDGARRGAPLGSSRAGRRQATLRRRPADAASPDFDRRVALLEAMLPDVRRHPLRLPSCTRRSSAPTWRARAGSRRAPREPDGDVRAVADWQQVILDHRDSKNANRHLLALADLYASLADGVRRAPSAREPALRPARPSRSWRTRRRGSTRRWRTRTARPSASRPRGASKPSSPSPCGWTVTASPSSAAAPPRAGRAPRGRAAAPRPAAAPVRALELLPSAGAYVPDDTDLALRDLGARAPRERRRRGGPAVGRDRRPRRRARRRRRDARRARCPTPSTRATR